MKSFLTPPRFPEDEQDRIARVQHAITLAALAGILLVTVYHVVAGELGILVPLLIVLAFVLLAIIFLRLGKLKWSGSLVAWTLLIFVNYLQFKSEGIHDVVSVAYPAVLIIAGLVLNRRYFFVFTVMALLSVAGVGWLEISGRIRGGMGLITGTSDIVDLVVILAVTTVTVRLLSDSLLSSLIRVRNDERELRKQAEQLGESARRYRTLFEGASDAIFIISNERYVDCNSRAISMFGCTRREELIGSFPWDFSPILQSDGFMSKEKAHDYLLMAEYGIPQTFLWKHVRKNGSEFEAEVSFSRMELSGERMVQALVRDVTGRSQSERALKESEQRYRTIIQQFAEGFVLVDESGNIVEWNASMEKISGVCGDEIIGLPYWEVVHRFLLPERRTRERYEYFQHFVLESLRTGVLDLQQKVFEVEIVRPDGTRKTIQQTPFVIQLEHGFRLGSIVQDITERKQIEIALRDSGERFRSLVQQSWDVISVHNSDMKVQYVTPSVERILGYTMREFQGMDVLSIVHPQDLGAVTVQLGKVMKKTNSGAPTLFRVRKADGTWIYVETVANNLLESPPINGIVLTYRDVTARVNSELQLRESEELHRGLVSAVPDVILRTDLDGNILFINETNFPALGFVPKENVLGKNVLSFVIPEQRERAATLMHSMKDNRTGLREYRMRFADGTEIDCEVNGDVLRDSGGAPFGMVYVVRDISQRHQEEAARKKLEAQLIQSQKLESIGTLASGIAHDFNNILNIVMGNISLIVSNRGNTDKLSKRLDAIERATDRGAQLVKQLLMYARRTKLEQRSVVVNTLIQEVAVLLEATFPKSIEVRLQLVPDLPSVNGDLNQLHQVFVNLSVNARDAMTSGGKLVIATDAVAGDVVRTKFPHAAAKRFVKISISDTGMGMDEETQKRIFDPFFTTKEAGKGTGLGLAVVHGIMESHAGYIDVESLPGMGTTMTLYLPAIEQVVDTRRDAESQFELIPGGTETILLVEDELMTRELVSEALISKGYAVVTAPDGEEGMTVYRHYESDIALVITDRGLPKVAGEELCTRIKRIRPEIPIVLVSGFVDPDHREALTSIGVDQILMKPYKLDELLVITRSLLDRRKSVPGASSD